MKDWTDTWIAFVIIGGAKLQVNCHKCFNVEEDPSSYNISRKRIYFALYKNLGCILSAVDYCVYIEDAL